MGCAVFADGETCLAECSRPGSAAMAVKLAASLGTSPHFWLNAQQAVDIYRAENT
jgi:plasmid maintenance system antidote protein VapI